MKFKKLLINNFFRYYGEQEIDLSTDDRKSVIVIIGDNGRGKTTILSAFNFVLYNRLADPLTINNMLNYRKQNELQIGRTEEVYVEAIIEEKGIEYCLRRFARFKKDLNGDIVNITPKDNASVYKIKTNGDKSKLDVKQFEDKFLIPEKLSGFFFFDGERINRLAKVDGKKEIKEAILNILGISYLDAAKKDIETMKRRLMKELKKYTNDINYEETLSNLDKTNYNIEKLNENLKKYAIKVNEAEEKVKDLSLQIRNYNSSEIKELEEQSRKFQKNLEIENKELNTVEKDIKNHITKNFKFYLAKQFTENTVKILDDKKKEGVLPSNIKDTFIDDIIKNGVCICGTCIKENSEEYKRLLKVKEVAGSKELDDAYYSLKSIIKKIEIESSLFYEKLDKLVEKRNKIKEIIYDYKEEVERIRNKLRNSDIEFIREVEKNRDDLRIEINSINQKIGCEKRNLENLENSKIRFENEIKTLKSNDKNVNRIKNKLSTVSKLEELNNDFKDMFTEVVREELDKKIKEVFSEITNKDYRIPVLTKEFELKIISKLNQVGIEDSLKNDEMLSTGEGQITSLSFIGALVAYARENKDDDILSRLSGEEYPIVMDSPFGNLDEIHTKNVASNIGKLSSQVIIIVSEKQWKGNVENNIIDQVNRKYIINDGDIVKFGAECSFIKKEEF